MISMIPLEIAFSSCGMGRNASFSFVCSFTYSSSKTRCSWMLRALSLVVFALSIAVTCVCEDTIECWADSPDSKLAPTTFRECRHLIRQMNSFDKDEGPITFSRKPGVGYKLPVQWSLGTCVLAIDMISDDAEDTLTFREIGIEAYGVALACVITPPHLGGRRPVRRFPSTSSR